MSKKKNILIVYDYFFPGYKAGGPVQSLTNLAVAFENEYNFSILTSGYDLLSKQPYNNINLGSWNKTLLPGNSEVVNVFYLNKREPGYRKLKTILRELAPSVIYLNGIYSFRLFLQSLFISRSLLNKPKVVVCPRGMLQRGALDVKPDKKRFYLKALQFSGLLQKVHWHATNKEEAEDIGHYFPKNSGITIAPNIPKVPAKTVKPVRKEKGGLKLIFLSLIAEKKNLLLLITIMPSLPDNVTLDIYGPITNQKYWEACLKHIEECNGRVKYKGEIEPINVQYVLAQYHSLILLTKGENFGHALYECLSVGRPLITSHFTPWNELKKKNAGVNVDISDKGDCIKQINSLAQMSNDEFANLCNSAHEVAVSYYQTMNFEVDYKQLFN